MEKENVHGTLAQMEVNQQVTFPITRACTVRSTCNLVNLKTGYKFSTKTTRQDNTITVTRTA